MKTQQPFEVSGRKASFPQDYTTVDANLKAHSAHSEAYKVRTGIPFPFPYSPCIPCDLASIPEGVG